MGATHNRLERGAYLVLFFSLPWPGWSHPNWETHMGELQPLSPSRKGASVTPCGKKIMLGVRKEGPKRAQERGLGSPPESDQASPPHAACDILGSSFGSLGQRS